MIGGETGIKKKLEWDFDIPFDVQFGLDQHEPWYIIGPQNKYKELFVIKTYFRNQRRITMEFIPATYGANFVRNMGTVSYEKKNMFSAFAELILRKGAKITFSINGNRADPCDSNRWPEGWQSLAIKVTRMPVSDGDIINYAEVVYEWNSLMMGMVLSLADIVPLSDESDFLGAVEGSKHKCYVNKYERNPINRKICLENKGFSCAVCGFNFKEYYGEIGERYIHVHHTVPVSSMGEQHITNPLRELFPVCPNCHAMLHTCEPPMEIEKLKYIISKQKSIQEDTDI